MKQEDSPKDKKEEKQERIEAGDKLEQRLQDEKKKETVEEKREKKHEIKDKKEGQRTKKFEAIALGSALNISKKHGMYICDFIKNKKIDQAINDLNNVMSFKQPVPFKGEIPHRKGKEIMSGRYPIKASAYFINLLKSLRGNSLVNGLDLERTRIFLASAYWASRPMKPGNRLAKRTNVILKAKEFPDMGGKR